MVQTTEAMDMQLALQKPVLYSVLRVRLSFGPVGLLSTNNLSLLSQGMAGSCLVTTQTKAGIYFERDFALT
jgi:hypothetical protein